ncbi:Nucleolar protein 16 [Escovopsis weberi]|uniref:Nucleolar protein 16 n=1 Tax=Escovopsis weberi TaxID=150374 RepID=A0A0M8N5U8_ESCWE|nr:Nucleolar protein 16 [Escovopsis weberi]
MGRELQKKKRRSGRAPVKQSNRTKKILNPRGNNIIAKNWDKNETLSQNYRRLGLLARLKAPTGGTEKSLKHSSTSASASASSTSFATAAGSAPFSIPTTDKAILSEARVERDADGNIVRVVSVSANPLNDPLNKLDEEDGRGEAEKEEEEAEHEEWAGIDDAGATDVVKSLIRESRNAAPARARHQSEQEREWLGRLVERHGEDYGAMARDARLNPMQQTGADIARRIKRMRALEG